MKNIMEKDKSKLTREISKTEVYIRGIVKEQKSILNTAKSGLKKSEDKLKIIRNGMKIYEQGIRKPDENFYLLKKSYEKSLKDKDSFQKTIIITSETIEEANLRYFQGSQDEIEKITM